jgi:hypothetical protein
MIDILCTLKEVMRRRGVGRAYSLGAWPAQSLHVNIFMPMMQPWQGSLRRALGLVVVSDVLGGGVEADVELDMFVDDECVVN